MQTIAEVEAQAEKYSWRSYSRKHLVNRLIGRVRTLQRWLKEAEESRDEWKRRQESTEAMLIKHIQKHGPC